VADGLASTLVHPGRGPDRAHADLPATRHRLLLIARADGPLRRRPAARLPRPPRRRLTTRPRRGVPHRRELVRRGRGHPPVAGRYEPRVVPVPGSRARWSASPTSTTLLRTGPHRRHPAAGRLVHDRARPVGREPGTSSVRLRVRARHAASGGGAGRGTRVLRPDGVVVVMDEAVGQEPAPGDDVERPMYGLSLLVCLPDSKRTRGARRRARHGIETDHGPAQKRRLRPVRALLGWPVGQGAQAVVRRVSDDNPVAPRRYAGPVRHPVGLETLVRVLPGRSPLGAPLARTRFGPCGGVDVLADPACVAAAGAAGPH
jgi:hypothetical protein